MLREELVCVVCVYVSGVVVKIFTKNMIFPPQNVRDRTKLAGERELQKGDARELVRKAAGEIERDRKTVHFFNKTILTNSPLLCRHFTWEFSLDFASTVG